jgi:hypothetical protein
MRTLGNKSKLTAFRVTTVVALALALGSFTQHASAQTPTTKKPFAVGAITTELEHVAFAAQQSPKSTAMTAATGHVVQQDLIAGTTNSGPVTCFQPNGSMATITFHVTNGPAAPNYRTFTVMDGGEPMMGMSPDAYADCGTVNSNCSAGNCCPQPILRGNIVVSQQ